MTRAAPRVTEDPARSGEPSVRAGSYFFMDSGNANLDRIGVAAVGFPFGAMLGALVFAGNPIAIVGAGALTSAVLYGAGSSSGT